MHKLFLIIDFILRKFNRCIVLEVDTEKNYTITDMRISKVDIYDN